MSIFWAREVGKLELQPPAANSVNIRRLLKFFGLHRTAQMERVDEAQKNEAAVQN